jgi:hypothetical protein
MDQQPDQQLNLSLDLVKDESQLIEKKTYYDLTNGGIVIYQGKNTDDNGVSTFSFSDLIRDGTSTYKMLDITSRRIYGPIPDLSEGNSMISPNASIVDVFNGNGGKFGFPYFLKKSNKSNKSKKMKKGKRSTRRRK